MTSSRLSAPGRYALTLGLAVIVPAWWVVPRLNPLPPDPPPLRLGAATLAWLAEHPERSLLE